MVLEPGSAVEFSIDGFNGSWFPGTIISRVDSNKAVVHLHRLRPVPLPESHLEFKSGDKVEAFCNYYWWEAHITEDLRNGRFAVSLKNLKEVTLSKKRLRTPHDWINHNCVPSNRDIISELPDDVLHYIMNFMDTKDAVQTCVLSKRWKDLCKRLPSFTISSKFDMEHFKTFASWVLFSRDDSYSVHNLTINHCIDHELLDRVIKYALFCNVQDLRMNLDAPCRPSFEFLPSIFCCQSLTCLELSMWCEYDIKVPKSLHLPAVKKLVLKRVQFTAGDDGIVEPFSNCYMLNTLVLKCCSLSDHAQVLLVSNTTVSSLTIIRVQTCQFVLSTPNVCSFTITGTPGHQLFSTCYLSFLREVIVDIYMDRDRDWNQQISTMMKWLQVLYNAKILTFNTNASKVMLCGISRLLSTGLQPPSFVRLESVKVNMCFCSHSSDRQLNKLVEYLLQNSPMDKVDITNNYCLNYIQA